MKRKHSLINLVNLHYQYIDNVNLYIRTSGYSFQFLQGSCDDNTSYDILKVNYFVY